MGLGCFLLGLCASGIVSYHGRDPLRALAAELGRGARGMQSPVVAVLDFSYPKDGRSSGSMLVRERLTTYLASDGKVRVVERHLLGELAAELRLAGSGALDPESSRRLGKVLGADALVLGTLHDRPEEATEVHARLVAAESGAVLAAGTVVIRRSWWDPPVHPAAEPLARARSWAGSSHAPPAAASPPRRERFLDHRHAERFFTGGSTP